jgi:leucyl aminopeptidase (aminopeptidase T)
VSALAARGAEIGLEGAGLFAYPAVGRNNADLPPALTPVDPARLPATAPDLGPASATLADVLARHPLVIAPTEYSATAPLKIPFRGATMPGFTAAMIPALRLDYTEVARRVLLLAGLLDEAERADIRFRVEGEAARDLALVLDLRHRTAHASTGFFPDPGTVGNLPSGEAYIVPYEGEREGDPSRTAGDLPVQIGTEVVVYRIEGNRAVAVEAGGPEAAREAAALREEPAYGNMAELGLGVLGGLGVEPVGELLLDEKLGVHIAFGRSDHFGGRVGPGDFSRPEAVIHLDRVYVPAMQPRIRLVAADLVAPGGRVTPLVRDDAWVV